MKIYKLLGNLAGGVLFALIFLALSGCASGDCGDPSEARCIWGGVDG